MEAIEFAERLALAAARPSGEIDLLAIASKLGVERLEPAILCVEGCLVRSREGALSISYRRDRPRTRQRFTVAHELAHIIIAKVMGVALEPRVERNAEKYSRIEELADRVAASLLMPEQLVIDHLRRLQGTNREPNSGRMTINRLARAFGVARIVAVRRLFEIPRLIAVWIRVAYDDDPYTEAPPLYSCDRTSGTSLCGSEVSIVCRLLNEIRAEREVEIDVDTYSGRKRLPCDVWSQLGVRKRSKLMEHWVVGWQYDDVDA